MITVLTGGTGGAKLVQGLAQVVPPEEIVAVVNTGDDLIWWGLHVSPDLDSITYALAGMLSADRGWGVEGDTFHCLEAMRRLGAPAWFQLGDRDLSTHLVRSELLATGKTLSEATGEVTRRLGVSARVLPMTDCRVETRVLTTRGEISFQEYFVRERFAPAVQSVRFAGAAESRPAPGVVEAIENAEVVLLAPSNPITSIGPILAVPGIREALKCTPAPVGAVSPIVSGAAVSGPAGRLMQAQGLPVSVEGVARAYADFVDVLLVDPGDATPAVAVRGLGVRLHSTCVIMKSSSDRANLARTALEVTRHETKFRKSSTLGAR